MNRRAIAALGLGLAITAGYNACSNVRLERPEGDMSSLAQKGDFCVAGENEETESKILFVIDKSGSNADDLAETPPYHGNDPDLQKRIGSISLFFNAHRTQSNIKWGLISFQGTGAKSYIVDPAASNAPRFGNAVEFGAALAQFSSEQDIGLTPYMSALAVARDMISADLATAAAASKPVALYNIVFMSDGAPTDFDPSGVGLPAETRHFNSVASIVALSPGNIHLHTVYYSNTENDQFRINAGGLSTMATYGYGKFVDLENADTLNLDDLITRAEHKAWMLRHFQVYNLNSAMCDDGTIDVDSDSDGLCDKDEVRYNTLFATKLADPIWGGKKFDPLNRNSLKSDYSDMIVLKKMLLTGAASLPVCSTGLTDTDHDLLTDCEEALLNATNPSGRTPQWTSYLVNTGGKGDKKNPDSDGDGFIDSVELFGTGLMSAAVNFNNSIDTVAPNVSGFDLMFEHRSPRLPAVVNDSTYDISIRPTGFNDVGDNCYTYNQTALKLYPTKALTAAAKLSGMGQLAHNAGENVILVYYLTAKEDDPNGREVSFRYSFQKLKVGNERLPSNALKLDSFELYKIPQP